MTFFLVKLEKFWNTYLYIQNYQLPNYDLTSTHNLQRTIIILILNHDLLLVSRW